MAVSVTILRRTLMMVLFSIVVGGVVTYRRQRLSGVATEPPVWPDFPDLRVVPAPDVPADGVAETWRPVDEDGSVPDGYPVKVKESSGIFHVPGGRFYDRTNGDRHYPSPEAAAADGYRQSKS